MLCLISPSKTLDFETPRTFPEPTLPDFLPHSEKLVKCARKMSVEDIEELMEVSEAIASLNHLRFREWKLPFTPNNSRPAIMAFKGDVYEGLEPWTLDKKGLHWLQSHLYILSGLYGLLRPLDLIQPYRLEMGLPLSNPEGRNLYAYWGNLLTEKVEAVEQQLIVNLASDEYYKALKPRNLSARIVTPQFKDWKNGQYKMISFFAKKARGLMVRYMVDHRVAQAEDLLGFDLEGYSFNEALSKDDQPVFSRKVG